MRNVTDEEIIRIVYKQRPRIFFEVGRDVLPQIKRLTDHDGNYLWSPSGVRNRELSPPNGYLLGYEIREVDGDGLRLVTVVNDMNSVLSLEEI